MRNKHTLRDKIFVLLKRPTCLVSSYTPIPGGKMDAVRLSEEDIYHSVIERVSGRVVNYQHYWKMTLNVKMIKNVK